MARIRTIKPEFWSDEKLAECSLPARLLFIGTWNFADDEGRMEYSPKRLKMQIFPGDLIDVTPLVEELIKNGLVTVYRLGDRDYLAIPNFNKHQKIDHPRVSVIPAPPVDKSTSTRVVLVEPSPNPQRALAPELKGMEGTGKEKTISSEPKTSSDSVSPSPRKRKPHRTALPENFKISDDSRKWAAERGYTHLEEHLEHFVGIAKAKGYMYADWDQAFKNAVQADWAKLNGKNKTNGSGAQPKPVSAVEELRKSLGAPPRTERVVQ